MGLLTKIQSLISNFVNGYINLTVDFENARHAFSSLYIDWYQSRGYEEIYSSLPTLDFLQIEIVKHFLAYHNEIVCYRSEEVFQIRNWNYICYLDVWYSQSLRRQNEKWTRDYIHKHQFRKPSQRLLRSFEQETVNIEQQQQQQQQNKIALSITCF